MKKRCFRYSRLLLASQSAIHVVSDVIINAVQNELPGIASTCNWVGIDIADVTLPLYLLVLQTLALLHVSNVSRQE